ncbi:MAG TPA: BON domain-containing protein [Albitalea sp.]|nr:BON domain-containing protein [Albitalea sp.]
MDKTLLRLAAALMAATALLGLASCQRDDKRTVGQQVDSALDKAQHETARAADVVAKETKDAAITASINAALVHDATLSALKVEVHTTDGRVSLSGTAPDAASRDRATQLAQQVAGVTHVDNQLRVSR